MRQHERISLRLAWHNERMKELMSQGTGFVEASSKAYDEVRKMKPADLAAWREKKGQR